MKTYHIIDTRHRDVRGELKHYTFEQIKEYFKPNKDDFPQLYTKWEKTLDIYDLKEYLDYEADGMEQPYIFEEDEVK